MKHLFFGSVALLALAAAGPAGAADMPVKGARMQAAPPVGVYNWTGFYIGGNVGYGWGNRTAAFTPDDVLAIFTCGGDLGGTCPLRRLSISTVSSAVCRLDIIGSSIKTG